MNGELMKSLVDLIDESLAEIEELKKSDRFSASEISMGDSDSGVSGKDKNGSLGKEEAEKADDDDKDDEDEDKKDDKDMDKADGKNAEADPNAGHHKVAKGEEAEKADDDSDDKDDDDKKKDDDDMDKADGKNRESDPNGGSHKMAKSDEDDSFGEELKKSREESETLIKSYIDEKVGSLEATLATIVGAIKDLADSPVPSKGSSYKAVTPLQKSEPEAEILSKAVVADKLFELKKSGETVSTEDITSVELGTPNELARIVTKYNIK